MERKLQERMVGAGVLVIALVILGPLVLDGRRDATVGEDAAPGQRADELRSHTFSLATPDTATTGAGPERAANDMPAAPSSAPPALARSPAPPPPAVPSVPDTSAAAPAVQAPPVEAEPAPVASPSPEAKPQAAPSAGGWLVQVGTFGQKGNAERLVASLEKKGFAAFISPTSRAGRALYRVRVGPAGTREAAAGLASRLAAAGQSGQVVAQ